MIRAIIVAVILAFGLESSNAKEEDTGDQTAFWKTVGHWTVWVDRTLENACFIATTFEDFMVVEGVSSSKDPFAL